MIEYWLFTIFIALVIVGIQVGRIVDELAKRR